MEKLIITFDIAEKSKHLVVSDQVSWKGLCKSASLINGKKSKKVSAKTMEMNPGLNTVELELEDAENICDYLFAETEIKSCVIPEGVKSIGRNAFRKCEKLESITLPSTLEVIETNAFGLCSALKRILVPTSVKRAYFENYDINRVEFAPGREVLPEGVYNDCDDESLEITVPEGITSIKRSEDRNYPFRDINIKGFKFPSTLKEIGLDAFNYTTLGHLEWPAGVPAADQSIQVTGNGFAKLGYFALPQVPDTLILKDYNCDTLIIPANVKKIVVNGLEGLRHIYVDPDNKVYDSRNNCNAVIETATNTMIIAGALTTVPEGVVEIDANGITAAGKCPELPSSLQKIDCSFDEFKEINITPFLLNALQGLFNFNGIITFSSDVKELSGAVEEKSSWGDVSLDGQFFRSCVFEKLVLPEKLEKIGANCFRDCSVKSSLVIPASVKEFGEYAFAMNGDGSELILPEGMTSIPELAFAYMRRFRVVVPESVTEIGHGAFADWYPDNVVLPSHLKVLNNIFRPSRDNSSKHSVITIPEGVETIVTKKDNWDKSMFMDADEIICKAAVAPQFVGEVDHLANGTISYPKGADYSSWEPIFKGWKFQEM